MGAELEVMTGMGALDSLVWRGRLVPYLRERSLVSSHGMGARKPESQLQLQETRGHSDCTQGRGKPWYSGIS